MALILETELTNLKWCGWQNSRLFEYLERQTWTYEKKVRESWVCKCCQYNNVMSNGKTPVTCQSKWYVSFIDNSRRKIVIKYHTQQVIDRTSVRCEKSGNVSMFKFPFRSTVQSRFFEPPRKTKIVSKIGYFKKSGVKLQCSTEERGTTFGLSYWEVRKN